MAFLDCDARTARDGGLLMIPGSTADFTGTTPTIAPSTAAEQVEAIFTTDAASLTMP